MIRKRAASSARVMGRGDRGSTLHVYPNTTACLKYYRRFGPVGHIFYLTDSLSVMACNFTTVSVSDKTTIILKAIKLFHCIFTCNSLKKRKTC